MENKDGSQAHPTLTSAPSVEEAEKHLATGGVDGNAKKKRRRGKSKRKIMKPFIKIPWQQRRKNTEKINKLNRNQKRIISKTQAPFNNNQFLMEIHKPEPENSFQLPRTPSARTRDSSFSVDSEENYFFSLPEDEEEFLTKEFSSVYEDAQCERLASMSKADLIQEYLLLEAKHEALTKRYDKGKRSEKYTSPTDKPKTELDSLNEVTMKLKERDAHIEELKTANEKLRQQNERLRQSRHSSSADSESDSSSTSVSSSSCSSTKGSFEFSVRNQGRLPMITNEQPLVNGFANEDSVGNGEIESDNMELVNGEVSDNVDDLPVRNGHTESGNVDNV